MSQTINFSRTETSKFGNAAQPRQEVIGRKNNMISGLNTAASASFKTGKAMYFVVCVLALGGATNAQLICKCTSGYSLNKLSKLNVFGNFQSKVGGCADKYSLSGMVFGQDQHPQTDNTDWYCKFPVHRGCESWVDCPELFFEIEFNSFSGGESKLRSANCWCFSVDETRDSFVMDLTTQGIESNPGPPSSGATLKVHPAFVPQITKDVVELGGVDVIPSQMPYATPLGDCANGRYAPSFINSTLNEQLRLWDIMMVDAVPKDGKGKEPLNSDGVGSATGILCGKRQMVVEQHLRSKNFNITNFNYHVALSTTEPQIEVSEMEAIYTNSINGWSAKYGDLANLDRATREKKYLIPAITTSRYTNDTTITTEWKALHSAASHGSCYVRFFVKLWLDFITQSIRLELNKNGVIYSENNTGSQPAWVMASSHSERLARNAPYDNRPDMVMISETIGEIFTGNQFLFSNDHGECSRIFAGYVRKYAGAWPQTRYTIGDSELCSTAINIGGCDVVVELVGDRMGLVPPTTTANPHPTAILSFALEFAKQTSSDNDLMAAWEIASAFGIRTNLGTFASSRMLGATTDAFWSNGRLSLPPDLTMPAFFQPFCDRCLISKAVLQLCALQHRDMLNHLMSHHVWTSVASQISFHGNNITRELLQAGGGNTDEGTAYKVINDLISPQFGRFRTTNLMLAHAATSLWLYGFRPREITMRAIRHSENLLCNKKYYETIMEERCMPMLWTGWEVLEVALHMVDSHVPPIRGHTIKQQTEGGLTWGTRLEDRNHVRLSRTMPVIRDYPWLLDGGIDYSMRYYMMDLTGRRTFWKKPNVTTRPTNTIELDVCMANDRGWKTIGFRYPMLGQCPSFDPISNDQLSWMFIWDDPEQYEWARMITYQQPDVTTTLSFRFASGSNAFDEGSIIRLFPELMADILDAYSPEIDMSTVYNVSFGVESDRQLGGSAPGNDPRFDAAFRWITVGKRDSGLGLARGPRGEPRHLKQQRTISDRGAANNRFSSLPIDPEMREAVGEEAIKRGTITESQSIKNAVPTLKRDSRQAKDIQKREADDNALLDEAIRENRRQKDESIPDLMSSGAPGDQLRQEASYAQVANKTMNKDKELTELRHARELKDASRLNDIQRMDLTADKIDEANRDQLPIKYKTDTDATLELQDEMRRKKTGQRSLN